MSAADDHPTLAVEHFTGVSRARLAGRLDERLSKAPFAVLQGRGAAVVFDFENVVDVTDDGARNWLAIIKELPSERYYFIKCRPAMLRRFALAAGFGGRGHVVSFYCPYQCDGCGARFESVLDLRRDRMLVAKKTAPPARCPRCGAAARFDGAQAAYLERASTWHLPRLAVDVESVIDGNAPPSALHLEKTVRGDLTVLWLSGTLDKPERLRRLIDGLEETVLVVLGGVTVATQDGVQALVAMLEASRADVLLARMPAPVLARLAATPGALRRTRVVSVVVERACGACGVATAMDVLRWRDGEPVDGLRCPSCQEQGLSPLPAEVRTALSTLPVGVAPPATHAFLDTDAPPPYRATGTSTAT